MSDRARPLDIFLAAGEASGDELGARLMASLKRATGGAVSFRGIGGPGMVGEGLDLLFPGSDIAIMGPRAIVARLFTIIRRLREAVDAVVARPPDMLIVIDSPEFTQRLARRVRKRLLDLPIVKYVAPQAWAWRPGRVPRMRAFLDHILALLPFEPDFYARLGGPTTTYVGHPMIERLAQLRPNPAEALERERRERPVLLILPGSRVSEVSRLMPIFGETLRQVVARIGPVEAVMPVVPHLETEVARAAADWPVAPRLITGADEKWQAFRRARAALAASGTVSLELGLAGVPMVIAYRIEPWLVPLIRRLVKTPSVVLTNLILGENVVPEYLQGDARPERLTEGLAPLLDGGDEREQQMSAFARLDTLMSLGDETPSSRAARVVLDVFETKTGRRAPRY